MYLVFESNGKIKTAQLIEDKDPSTKNVTIYDEANKKIKIKREQIILTLNQPQPSLIEHAQALAEEMDVPFLWSFCDDCAHSIDYFAKDYFGEHASEAEILSLFITFQNHPVYFHKKGKGLYQRADEKTLELALLAIEKKKARLAQQETWTQEIIEGKIPDHWSSEILTQFLIKPDKNTDQWKAFEKAMEHLKKNIPEMLLYLKVFSDPLLILHHQFEAENFPKGTQFPETELPQINIDELPYNAHTCYSIDSVDTDEIDDALSCEIIDDHTVRIGIHIATPALGIEKDSTLDLIAQDRMSTVYTPGHKITMLPMPVVDLFSLNEQEKKPALSIYGTFNLNTGELLNTETRLQSITVTKNLRTEHIDGLLTEEALAQPQSTFELINFFKPLWTITQFLSRQRDEIRGRAEQLNKLDYMAEIHGDYLDPTTKISVKTRPRTAPTHRIVQEMMIFANTQWANLLKERKIAAIFRSQAFGRTRMSTFANPHEGIGAEQYIWATSPLRRYPDLVCQRQLICIAKHGIRAALVTPYPFKDASLISIIGIFESKYTLYNQHQRQLETYWLLKYLQQEALYTIHAQVLKNTQYVRLEEIGLSFPIQNLPPSVEAGDLVQVKVNEIDLMTLSTSLSYIKTLS